MTNHCPFLLTGIAFTDLPVSTTDGSSFSWATEGCLGGLWYLHVQGVESGPFPKQGCVMYCQLEGTSKGYLLAILSLQQQGLVFLHVS